MKFLTPIALAALGLMATPAQAQDNPKTQAYAGPLIGYDNVSVSNVNGSAGKGGLTYGGVLGVDAPMGEHTRIGLETELTSSTTSQTYTSGTAAAKITAGRDLSISAKLGYMVTPKFETFVKFGYTNARINATLSNNGAVVGSGGQNESGYRVGVGAEYFLNAVRLRMEYRYSNYGDLSINGVSTGLTVQQHQVLAGMTYGF